MYKKSYLFVLAFLIPSLTVSAQNITLTPLTVDFKDVVALKVFSPVVSFDLSSKDAFTTDQILIAPNQINILATKDFDLSVKALEPYFESDQETSLPIDVLRLESMSSDGNGNPVNLSQQDQSILSNSSASLSKNIHMRYILKTHSNYALFRKLNPGVYRGTLIFTASID